MARGRCNFVVPALSRDPYAAADVVRAEWLTASLQYCRWWLWVPAPVRNCALGRDDGAIGFVPLLATVDLAAHERDGALIDAGGIPRLDSREVGLSRLVSSARAPAMRLQKIRGRGQRIGRDLEIT
jgi:hypothetical protein